MQYLLRCTTFFLVVFVPFLLTGLLFLPAWAQGPTTVTVDTTSIAVNGDTSSASALNANPGADGVISFREALAAVNNDTVSGHTIDFNLPHGATIFFNGTLFLTAPNTIIDGDVGGDGFPDVVFESPNDILWLRVTSENNTIRNLAFKQLDLFGPGAHHNKILDSYIGTDVAGLVEHPRIGNGVTIRNGGHDNIIEHNIIAGNTIHPGPDTQFGRVGIAIQDSAHDNIVQSNWIGVNSVGNPLPNDIGIVLVTGASRNFIGDNRTSANCDGPCNVISGNSWSGILIEGSSSISNVVKGNYIGLSPAGATSAPNGYSGVSIHAGARQNTVGGERTGTVCDGPCNVISGNTENGVNIARTGTISNVVRGNYVGLSPTGAISIPNGLHGVEVWGGAAQNIIGGVRSGTACDGPCNVISGNIRRGVTIYGTGTFSNMVQGNYVGVDPFGTTGIANAWSGVGVVNGASQNIIGGEHDSIDCGGACNVISGNGLAGVALLDDGTDNNVVQGNYIGLNATGTITVPNGFMGATAQRGASNNTIGGERQGTACNGPCNVIGGNRQQGVLLLGTVTSSKQAISNLTRVNSIELTSTGPITDVNGYVDLTNQSDAAQNTVGGVLLGEDCNGPCDVRSSNFQEDTQFLNTQTGSNRVEGNYIGLNPGGTVAMPNELDGVRIANGSTQNVIGGEREPGECAGVCNVIGGNEGTGVTVIGETTRGNTIRGNAIRGNGGLDIDLGDDGLTLNDPDDADTGPNDLLNFPEDLSANFDGNNSTITGTLSTTSPGEAVVDLYASDEINPPNFVQAQIYLGSATPNSAGEFALSITGQLPFPFIGATATDRDGSTSEFSCIPKPGVPGADSDRDGLSDSVELGVTRARADGQTVTLDPCNPDTDGDGLLDPWEVDQNVEGAGFDLDKDGIPDVDRDQTFFPYRWQADGRVMFDYRITGRLSKVDRPDPFHKDIYLEIDWEDCQQSGVFDFGGCFDFPFKGFPIDPTHHAPDITALDDVINLFRQARVRNPDGQDGIRLHIFVDQGIRHMPICDMGESTLRSKLGTPYQALIFPKGFEARKLVFRHVGSIHSTLRDDVPGACELPWLWNTLWAGYGRAELPDYDHSPFGNALIGGQDIIVSLGPLWICPEENLVGGFLPACFRGMVQSTLVNPGIFPAKVMGQTPVFSRPLQMYLGEPPLQGSRQLWGRTLMHLLGHSLGLEDETVIGNQPDIPGFSSPRLYDLDENGWNNLQFTPVNGGTAPTESFPHFDQLVRQDVDGDTIIEALDNCPGRRNEGQTDLDGDGYGNLCDLDIDNDGFPNDLEDLIVPRGPARIAGEEKTGRAIAVDPFPMDTDNDGLDNPVDEDDDGDGVLDTTDNCILTANLDQADTDGDGIGDECDLDADNDDVPNPIEEFSDSDPLDPASQPEFIGRDNVCADGLDNDLDGQVDSSDEGCVDTDNDNTPDFVDNCPLLSNDIFHNWDGDDLGDECDPDDDNDNIADETDLCPSTLPGALVDGNGCSDDEVDPDGDDICTPFVLGVGPSNCTGFDNCPLVPNPDQLDTDGDEIGDACSFALEGLILNPGSVPGGSTAAGTVTLTEPVPSGSALVQLSSSDSAVAALPATVAIPAGADGAIFTITTNPVSTTTSVIIRASYGPDVKAATLIVTPSAANVPTFIYLPLIFKNSN